MNVTKKAKGKTHHKAQLQCLHDGLITLKRKFSGNIPY